MMMSRLNIKANRGYTGCSALVKSIWCATARSLSVLPRELVWCVHVWTGISLYKNKAWLYLMSCKCKWCIRVSSGAFVCQVVHSCVKWCIHVSSGAFVCQAFVCQAFVCQAFVCQAFVCQAFVCQAFVCQAFVCQAFVCHSWRRS